jgi:predicted flap endonuclease-1-like 5' DNA nuclease
VASIDAIEGIGPRHAEKLRASGVRTCEALLARGATRKGRKELAASTGLGDTRILEWVNRADLMRVKGVSSQYSDLLEAAGVDTVKELRRRNATNLTEAMEAANRRRRNRLVQRTPREKVVQKWIDGAKALPAVVQH